ncbi:hypothetical protein SmJEL517_g06213 [Synchytrium microbalum]|uniref:Beta-glucuronidase C-terminal domain-containing protein n=1 Tax=Synchytrium microbalum TaxID=1806994 RepID=A0A507BSP1_9FUNG|nr:uncharacterized protein SmJEL517_g06213 [Synchytrium microbalum]TPX30159.1 hypothetical protein SmJEL517_g06213 [Synchytrium microbalum]
MAGMLHVLMLVVLLLSAQLALGLTVNVDLALNADGSLASLIDQYSNPVDAEFMCLSIEWNHLPEGFLLYAQGKPTGNLNTYSLNLIKNLAAGVKYQGSPTLRVGGNSATLMWWSRSTLLRPTTANLTVAPISLGLIDRIASATQSRVVPDISMLLQDPVAASEFVRDGILSNVNYKNLLAIELGNEPELWIKKAFRTGNWSYTTDYLTEFLSYTTRITNDVQTIPKTYFWGPAMSTNGNLTSFISSNQAAVSGLTFHRYALSGCTDDVRLVNVPLLLLDPQPNSYAFLKAAINLTNAEGALTGQDPKRLIAGEINSVSCGGADGVSNVFGAAIWGLDNFLTLANLNVYKVCVHGVQGDFKTNSTADHSYAPWVTDLHANVVHVRPVYYSMLLFNRIMGSANSTVRPLAFTIADSSGITNATATPNVKIWLVHTVSGYNVVILHKDLSLPAVNLVINAASIPFDTGFAVVERMTAPSVYSRTGITISGMSLDESSDGRPVGTWQPETIASADGGIYRITVNTGSVAVLYLGGSGPSSPIGMASSANERHSRIMPLVVLMVVGLITFI